MIVLLVTIPVMIVKEKKKTNVNLVTIHGTENSTKNSELVPVKPDTLMTVVKFVTELINQKESIPILP